MKYLPTLVTASANPRPIILKYEGQFILELKIKLYSEAKFCLFQVVKRAAIATAFVAAIGGALTVFRILKKDLKLF